QSLVRDDRTREAAIAGSAIDRVPVQPVASIAQQLRGRRHDNSLAVGGDGRAVNTHRRVGPDGNDPDHAVVADSRTRHHSAIERRAGGGNQPLQVPGHLAVLDDERNLTSGAVGLYAILGIVADSCVADDGLNAAAGHRLDLDPATGPGAAVFGDRRIGDEQFRGRTRIEGYSEAVRAVEASDRAIFDVQRAAGNEAHSVGRRTDSEDIETAQINDIRRTCVHDDAVAGGEHAAFSIRTRNRERLVDRDSAEASRIETTYLPARGSLADRTGECLARRGTAARIDIITHPGDPCPARLSLSGCRANCRSDERYGGQHADDCPHLRSPSSRNEDYTDSDARPNTNRRDGGVRAVGC